MRNMILTIGVLVLSVGAALLYPNEGKAGTSGISFSQVSPASAEKGGKVLVTYFTWPEPDGVDASSGASRIILSLIHI